VILGDAFTDVVVPVHLITREFFELAADRLNPGGSFLMNVIDYEDRLRALSSVVATLREVFPVVEVWTHQVPPAPGSRMVFVVVAGDAPTPADSIHVPAPEIMRFGALADGMVDAAGRDARPDPDRRLRADRPADGAAGLAQKNRSCAPRTCVRRTARGRAAARRPARRPPPRCCTCRNSPGRWP
jgi:hypothetical protein